MVKVTCTRALSAFKARIKVLQCSEVLTFALFLRRSPRSRNSEAPSDERNGDRNAKKHRQRASVSGKREMTDDAMMMSTSVANKRHSAPLPADSSQPSSVNSSLNNLSHSKIATQLSFIMQCLAIWFRSAILKAVIHGRCRE